MVASPFARVIDIDEELVNSESKSIANDLRISSATSPMGEPSSHLRRLPTEWLARTTRFLPYPNLHPIWVSLKLGRMLDTPSPSGSPSPQLRNPRAGDPLCPQDQVVDLFGGSGSQPRLMRVGPSRVARVIITTSRKDRSSTWTAEFDLRLTLPHRPPGTPIATGLSVSTAPSPGRRECFALWLVEPREGLGAGGCQPLFALGDGAGPAPSSMRSVPTAPYFRTSRNT